MGTFDLGIVLLAVGGWWLVLEAIYYVGARRANRPPAPAQPVICRCGHGRAWHQHHHDRTYCAACDCGRYKAARRWLT